MNRATDRGFLGVAPTVLLIICGLFLLVRGWDAAQAVLAPPEAASQTGNPSVSPLLAQVRAMDGDLARVEAPKRDPLHRKVVHRRTRPSQPEPPAETIPPRLKMILFDTVNPIVQISHGGQRSGNLHIGDAFMGWRVDMILEDRAVVSKDTETFTIRRAQ